jgi:hypothetical protein
MKNEPEVSQEDAYFCERCGTQLFTVDEISSMICDACMKSRKKEITKQGTFHCKICGKRLPEMSQIAQGLCENCKASIIRKLK